MQIPYEDDDHLIVDADALDIDIQLSERVTAPAPAMRPAIIRSIGQQPASAPCPVYLHGAALQQILSHAMPITNREVGGLLIGEFREDDGRYITIAGSIRAAHTQESRANLTFTHESWRQLLGDLERLYPGKVILGWYHTHPGYGIFLSDHDTYIQKNFFNARHQVALVVDPIARKLGIFYWEAQRITRLPGIPLYGDPSVIEAALAQLDYGTGAVPAVDFREPAAIDYTTVYAITQFEEVLEQTLQATAQSAVIIEQGLVDISEKLKPVLKSIHAPKMPGNRPPDKKPEQSKKA